MTLICPSLFRRRQWWRRRQRQHQRWQHTVAHNTKETQFKYYYLCAFSRLPYACTCYGWNKRVSLVHSHLCTVTAQLDSRWKREKKRDIVPACKRFGFFVALHFPQNTKLEMDHRNSVLPSSPAQDDWWNNVCRTAGIIVSIISNNLSVIFNGGLSFRHSPGEMRKSEIHTDK